MPRYSGFTEDKVTKNGRPKLVYVGLSPATTRYHRLMELARLYNCSYHRIVLDALDWYLNTKVPKKN